MKNLHRIILADPVLTGHKFGGLHVVITKRLFMDLESAIVLGCHERIHGTTVCYLVSLARSLGFGSCMLPLKNCCHRGVVSVDAVGAAAPTDFEEYSF